MTDIPIIFSAPMVRALLDGRKTMTRRIISLDNCEFRSFGAGKAAKLFWREHAAWDGASIDRGFPDADGMYRSGYLHVPCHDDDESQDGCAYCREFGRAGTTHRLLPKVEAGDRLWVREAAAFIDNSQFDMPSYWQYRADANGSDLPGDWPADEKDNPERPRWRPSIHMPRVASRITLLVKAVKIERLQDISDIDVIAEGVVAFQSGSTPMFGVHVEGGYEHAGLTPRETFMNLWCALHGPAAWNANPFVVATSFRVIKANIDASEARIAA